MSSRSRSQRAFVQNSLPEADADAEAQKTKPFLAMLNDCAEVQKSASPSRRRTTRVQKLDAPRPGLPVFFGMIKRSLAWLRKRYTYSAKKKLRIVESISLGEKRFVAIVHAEGRQFLIGGSASTVSLLTQLRTTGKAKKAAPSISRSAEHSA
jgi:hypothetical protein